MSVGVEGDRNESFESLEAAVLETSRGRWFLEEYAKRQRSTETLAILEILRKLENTITSNSMSLAPKAAETARPINQEHFIAIASGMAFAYNAHDIVRIVVRLRLDPSLDGEVLILTEV